MTINCGFSVKVLGGKLSAAVAATRDYPLFDVWGFILEGIGHFSGAAAQALSHYPLLGLLSITDASGMSISRNFSVERCECCHTRAEPIPPSIRSQEPPEQTVDSPARRKASSATLKKEHLVRLIQKGTSPPLSALAVRSSQSDRPMMDIEIGVGLFVLHPK